jgi:predicted DNA-binding protein (MmcQ/YjbR family)
MRREEAERACQALAGAVLEYPFGTETGVYKVGGKVFALFGSMGMNLKCDPGLAETLREAYVGVVPGYHMNKRHWNTITLDGDVPDAVIADMIEDSYDLVVSSLSKAVQRGLGWEPSTD